MWVVFYRLAPTHERKVSGDMSPPHTAHDNRTTAPSTVRTRIYSGMVINGFARLMRLVAMSIAMFNAPLKRLCSASFRFSNPYLHFKREVRFISL